MSRSTLPSRILIPVANPLTAEELVQIGAALLDPKAGVLTVLGIVEVPEGTPLSEGATHARQARRLLQRVLDYAPDGREDPHRRSHRAARRRRSRRGGDRAGRRSDRHRLGRQASRPRSRAQPTPVFSPTIDEVVRESPCDIAVVKQGAPMEFGRILVPIRGGPHAELALQFRRHPGPPRRRQGRGPARGAGRPDARQFDPRPRGPWPSLSASTPRATSRNRHAGSPGRSRGHPARGGERRRR